VTFYYADGSGHYVAPVHLERQAAATIDVMQLIAAQRPDAEGNVMPLSAQFGSAVLSSANGITERMTLVASAATFNVGAGTCCTNLVYCYGYTSPTVEPSGDSTPVGSSMQCDCKAVYNNGNSVTVSGCTWSSSSAAVAMIGSSSGVMTGVSPGSVTISAQFPGLEVWSGTLCPPQTCPTQVLNASSTELVETPIQHNYPKNPLPNACWISSFFDAVRNSHAHHADDVVYDNGKGTGGVTPAYGTPVYSMEAGTVVATVSTAGPASQGYPACIGTNAPGNYVKIQTSDGYTTLYFHVKPLSNITKGASVAAGQQIGTLDNSGCQSGAHVHVARKNSSGVPVNFTLPCTNPTPANKFFDGLVDDSVPDNL
jgi:Peptidase family M23